LESGDGEWGDNRVSNLEIARTVDEIGFVRPAGSHDASRGLLKQLQSPCASGAGPVAVRLLSVALRGEKGWKVELMK
jgi:hypothetical protein